MHRREVLTSTLRVFGAAALCGSSASGQPQVNSAKSALPNLEIRDVRAILCQPASSRLIVVKVETNEPEVFGLGCATFTQRAEVVKSAVDTLKPFLLGRNPLDIEDIWRASYVSSYWRNGPVLNNAISGVDIALWDILGKVAKMPLYQLLGGKVRKAVDTYRHASGATVEEVEESVRSFMDQGYRHIRCQISAGGAGYGAKSAPASDESIPEHRRPSYYEPGPYVRKVPQLFDHLRTKLGDDVELLHDIHERVPPILAIKLAKDLEPFRLFFLEDPFSPEDVSYFKHLRQQTATPIAMGELFNNVNEFVPLIANQLIDFIRVHISQIGGLTPARKLAAMCEFFNVRTAWHGPGDVSPVGHAAQAHLDLTVPNFGIQEARDFTQAERDIFPGCPELKDGYYWLSDRPGVGVDLNEDLAKRFPIATDPPFDLKWGNYRRQDGTVIKP